MQKRVPDRCLQLRGGCGYMNDFAVARTDSDGRGQNGYRGTTEVTEEITGITGGSILD